MAIRGAADQIQQTLMTWENVEAHPHRFGGIEYSIGKREIGHVHGDSLVDIPFPKKIRDEIVAAGEAEPHHVLPETGWVSFYIRAESDVERAIQLLKRFLRSCPETAQSALAIWAKQDVVKHKAYA